jgi:hypothetical protein
MGGYIMEGNAISVFAKLNFRMGKGDAFSLFYLLKSLKAHPECPRKFTTAISHPALLTSFVGVGSHGEATTIWLGEVCRRCFKFPEMGNIVSNRLLKQWYKATRYGNL